MVRTPVSITLPRTCLDWIDRKVESRVYANRSHAIEVIVLEAMKHEEEFEQPSQLREKVVEGSSKSEVKPSL